MTVDELLTLARDVARNGSECDSPAEKLAHAVEEMFGIGFPCGYRQIEVVEDDENGGRIIRWDDEIEPDDARGIAVALLRAADEAEATRG